MKLIVTGPPLSQKYVDKLTRIGFQVRNGTSELLKMLGDYEDNSPRELTEQELGKSLTDAAVYVYGGLEPASSAALEMTRKLRLIAFMGTGWSDEGCVDPEAVRRLGIAVTNTPGANAPSVAELTIGVILALERKIIPLNSATKAGKGHPIRTRDISGCKLGIIGLGAIGSRVARHARQGFGMEVVYSGPHSKRDIEKELNIKKVSLDQLLSTSDFITVHSPGVSTRGLIGKKELALMTRNSFLINLAHPEIVDGAAITDALEKEEIQGAAYDGYYKEPKISARFLALPDDRLIVLPRVAWLTDDSYNRMADMAVTSIEALINKKDIPNLVNRGKR